ncbi:MAG: CDP-alcohol phosphatidyltransferase family protein [Anaerolineales bacterium]|nr:CDP-alcohol phosphatidyltransferase family protein [Anaerolineales bacterium]
MNDIRNHQRVNDILLGPLERPVLHWLAVHLPAWVTPDFCTFVGTCGALVILVSYVLSNLHPAFLWLASLGFVVNWLGDSLDGTLARHRNIERPVFGFFVDHTNDAACQIVIFLGLGLSPYVGFHVASLTLVAYMLLSVLVYVRTCASGEFKISYGKLGPTEIRALAIGLNAAMFFGGRQAIPLPAGAFGTILINPYDLIVAGIAVLLLVFFLVTAVRESIRMGKTNR